jgi:hypothetical protein
MYHIIIIFYLELHPLKWGEDQSDYDFHFILHI